MECLPPTVMNHYVTCFRMLTHLGVNNIWATGVLSKNRLRKCNIVGDKQPQIGMWTLWIAHIKQKSRATLRVVGLNDNRAVYIASSKFFEPKRFVRRLNKVEGKYFQEQQLSQFHYFESRTGVFSKGWTRAFPSTRLVSEWKQCGGPRLLICSMFQCWMLLFRMHVYCITLTKMKSMSLCLS